jgi:hypothetical protein
MLVGSYLTLLNTYLTPFGCYLTLLDTSSTLLSCYSILTQWLLNTYLPLLNITGHYPMPAQCLLDTSWTFCSPPLHHLAPPAHTQCLLDACSMLPDVTSHYSLPTQCLLAGRRPLQVWEVQVLFRCHYVTVTTTCAAVHFLCFKHRFGFSISYEYTMCSQTKVGSINTLWITVDYLLF